MNNPIFSNYQKQMLFGEQCKIEWELQEQWGLVNIEAYKYHLKGEIDIAKQILENFKLMAYHEWRESFKKIDRFGGALWRIGWE